jgi:NAD(P)-dependent dehydrogenase (short-subunit alcohol dehydrogenase family)
MKRRGWTPLLCQSLVAGSQDMTSFAATLLPFYGLVGPTDPTPYHAAKGAVTLMTKQDAVCYARDNIRVNSVHPGTILTPLVRQLGSRIPGGLPACLKLMGEKHPIGHAGEPIDVAYAVLFLASDEARFITGAALAIDGGYTAV